MRRALLPLLLLVLAACTPKFQPETESQEHEMKKAEWDCQRRWFEANPESSGRIGFKKYAFMVDCMKAHGYEVIEE